MIATGISRDQRVVPTRASSPATVAISVTSLYDLREKPRWASFEAGDGSVRARTTPSRRGAGPAFGIWETGGARGSGCRDRHGYDPPVARWSSARTLIARRLAGQRDHVTVLCVIVGT